MKKKELSEHLDKMGERMGEMVATPSRRCKLSQKQVDALRIGISVGLAYASLLVAGDMEPDNTTLEAVNLMECATATLMEAAEND